jgi:Uma2 family endonuclease
MGLAQPKLSFSPEDYLAFERTAQTRHEYLDGQIYAMAGGSPPHNAICFNVAGELYLQLKGKPCQGFTSDQKIRADPADLFSYPDVTIVCGELQFHDEFQDVLLNPKVIIEVLSPTTEAYDRGEKFARYRQIKTLSDYVLIAQDKPSLEHYVRQRGDRPWLYSVVTEMSGSITITSINCTLNLADVYAQIVFPKKRPPLFEVVSTLPTPKVLRKSRKAR